MSTRVAVAVLIVVIVVIVVGAAMVTLYVTGNLGNRTR